MISPFQKKSTQKIDAYDVLDENGNVVDTLYYPEGGTLYNQAKKNREAGNENYVYKTNKASDEIYTPTYKAKATTSIDPIAGTITVTGPSWLTSEIVNSDSFKKNYSENKALLSAVNLYRQNANAKMAMTDGSTVGVRDVINEFQDMANYSSENFALIQDFKDTQKARYGINMTDSDVAIANTFYDKDSGDYNKNGAVYLPKWAMDNYKWDDLASWDPKNGTVSAEDFFTKVFSEGFSDKTASGFQDEAIDKLKEFVNNNVYDSSNKELTDKKKAELESEEYATELARTIELNNLVNSNRPETSAAYDVALFAASTVNSFLAACNQALFSFSEVALALPNAIGQAMYSDTEGGTAGPAIAFAANPGLTMGILASMITGEAILAVERGEDISDYWDTIKGLTDEIYKTGIHQATREERLKWDKLKEELDEKNERISGAWTKGEFVGYMAWKVVENIVLLNPAGAAAGSAAEAVATSAPVRTIFARALGAEAAADLLSATGAVINFGVNVSTQGVLETLLDDKELVDKALESGRLTTELWEKIIENTLWNAVGELGGQVTNKALKFFFNETTAGRVLSMGATKMNALLGSAKYGLAVSVLKALHGGITDGKSLGEAILKANEAGDFNKAMELFNLGFYMNRRDIAKTLSKMPVFREASDEAMAAIEDAYGWIFGGSKFLSATTKEEAEAAIKEGLEAAHAEVGKELAKKAGATTEQITEVGKRVAKNYENIRKGILIRTNFENQIDALSKGMKIKFSEINKFASVELDEFAAADKRVAELAQKAKKAGAKLDFWEGKGSTMPKQGAEYLGIRSQNGRVQYKLKVAEDSGGWKNAIEKNSRGEDIPLFKSKQEYDTSVKYAEWATKKLVELEGILGEELTAALKDLHPKAGRYFQKVQDYMINNGYIQKGDAENILALRNGRGYGANGEYYLPTSRLVTEEGRLRGYEAKDAFGQDTTTITRKMNEDAVRKLVPGDMESGFADPVAQMFMRVRAFASIAQANDWSRAIMSVNAFTRSVSGYDADGVSVYKASTMEKTIAEKESDFKKAFTAKESSFKEAVSDAFSEGNPVNEAIEALKSLKKTPAEVEIGKKIKAEQAKFKEPLFGSGSRVAKTKDGQKTLKFLESAKGGGAQGVAINAATDDELGALLNSVADKVNPPLFNPSNVSAKDFKSWLDSMPQNTRKYIENRIAEQGLNLNITGARKVAKMEPDFVLNVKKSYVYEMGSPKKALGKTQEYKDFIVNTYRSNSDIKSAVFLRKHIAAYDQLVLKLAQEEAAREGLKISLDDFKSFGESFVKQVQGVSEKTLNGVIENAMRDPSFKGVIKQFVDAGVPEDLAKRYVALSQLEKLKAKDFAAPLKDTHGGRRASDIKRSVAKVKKGTLWWVGKNPVDADKIADVIGSGVESQVKSMLAETRLALAKYNVSELMDMNTYFKGVEKEMNELESKYLFKPGEKVGYRVSDAQRRNIVQLIGKDGQLRFYETDPLYASLVNEKYSTFRAPRKGLKGAIYNANRAMSSIFRWGTTGIDVRSYMNQWLKDPLDATILGGYRPFTDIDVGGVGSRAAAAYTDFIGTFGQKTLGKYIVRNVSDEVVNATWEANQKGLIEKYGQEWWDAFEKRAAGDLTGDAATAAVKRAAAQMVIKDTGYEALPGLGGMTRAQFFRVTESGKGIEELSVFELTRERAGAIFGGDETVANSGTMRKMFSKFEDIMENFSKGSYREVLMRDGVYARQYATAIESGMTMDEAKVWATRYALDATTDFGRTFAYGNDFIKSVPYLSAALNGQKSFWRLLEMDPVGIGTRLTFGIALPFARMLSLSLSDEKNREAYKQLREYEKSDHIYFVWHGEVFGIPVPEQIASFLNPFRHVIEKAADVQDASWVDLAASDILGILPLDLSGFVGLDENTLLDEENGLGSRIYRGVEKAISSLMSPTAKGAYMLVTGRDPYTGREIDTSYYVVDEEGKAELMDSTQSKIAKMFMDAFNNDETGEPGELFGHKISASAAEKILQNIFGRSTMLVADSMASGDFFNIVKPNTLAEQAMAPFEGPKYNIAKSDWNNAINTAYAEKQKLINSELFQKSYSIMRDSNYSDEKRAEAKRTYDTMLDRYDQLVLSIFQNMKNKYPEQYTQTRMAQAISLMTLDTGLTYHDTDYAQEVRNDAYYDARNRAIDTFLAMGFPQDVAGNTILGSGYYDKYGNYQFKIFTPYQIEQLSNTIYNTDEQIQASVKAALKEADINVSDFWDSYYKATTKAQRKELKQQWNFKVVQALYPLVSQYSIDTVLNNKETRELLDNYIMVDSPYQAKQYLYEIFGGNK